MTDEKQDEAIYELHTSKKAVISVQGRYEKDEGRWDRIPETPVDFHNVVGNYAKVSKEATRRNEFQIKSGFIDYLYHPEPYVAVKKEQHA